MFLPSAYGCGAHFEPDAEIGGARQSPKWLCYAQLISLDKYTAYLGANELPDLATYEALGLRLLRNGTLGPDTRPLRWSPMRANRKSCAIDSLTS